MSAQLLNGIFRFQLEQRALYVILIYLFLSLSSETVFEFRKLSFAVGHCQLPYRQWQTQKQVYRIHHSTCFNFPTLRSTFKLQVWIKDFARTAMFSRHYSKDRNATKII